MKKDRKFDGVIFDMDGTLIESVLDFDAIRSALKIPRDSGILEALAELPDGPRKVAHETLMNFELEAAEKATLLDGAQEIISACRKANLKIALLTRNTRRCLRRIMQRYPQLQFDLIRCREDGIIKPQPDGVLDACRQLGISPPRIACIGDFEYDIIAANAAGAFSILLTTSPRWSSFAEKADRVIHRLSDAHEILGV